MLVRPDYIPILSLKCELLDVFHDPLVAHLKARDAQTKPEPLDTFRRHPMETIGTHSPADLVERAFFEIISGHDELSPCENTGKDILAQSMLKVGSEFKWQPYSLLAHSGTTSCPNSPGSDDTPLDRSRSLAPAIGPFFDLGPLDLAAMEEAYEAALAQRPELDRWSFAAEQGWTRRHFTLPLFYERCAYSISFAGLDYIADHLGFQEGFPHAAANYYRTFVGWRMCVHESDVKERALRSRMAKKLTSWVGKGNGLRELGRPPKKDEVAAILKRDFPSGKGKLVWKEVTKHVAHQLEEGASEKTIKRAAQDIGWL